MAWGRLALIQAASDDAVLEKVASLFAYETKEPSDQQGLDNKKQELASEDSGEETSTASSSEQKQGHREPARFIRVNRVTPKKNVAKEKQDLTDAKLNLTKQAANKGTYQFALPEAVFNASQLAPLLLNGLGQSKDNKKPHIGKLIQQISKAKPVRKVPCHLQQRWPQKLLIIVDDHASLEPYQQDFLQIIEFFKQLLGEEQLETISFLQETLGEAHSYMLPWPMPKEDIDYQLWKKPPSRTAILLLSDLGEHDRSYHRSIRWKRWVRSLTHDNIGSDTPLLALSPGNASPHNTRVFDVFYPTALQDRGVVPRQVSKNGFALAEYSAKQLQKILTFLSVIPVIDAGLLRKLRLAFQWGELDLEGIIWNHPQVKDIGIGIRVLEEHANDYQVTFKDEYAAENSERLWKIVDKHHTHAHTGLKKYEQLNKTIINGEYDEEIADYLKQLNATLSQTSEMDKVAYEAMKKQGEAFLSACPNLMFNSCYEDEVHHLYKEVNKEKIKKGDWSERLEVGLDLSYFKNDPDTEQVREWYLMQIGAQGEFVLSNKINQSHRPILTFTSQVNLPLTLKTQQTQFSFQNIVKANTLYNELATGKTVLLNSDEAQFEIEAIQKPSWASNIFRNKEGLSASIEWLGEELTIPWNDEKSSLSFFVFSIDMVRGKWKWQEPFGEDEYGLFCDLAIKGITQRFRWIEPGSFMMGSPQDEAGREPHELLEGSEEQHEVTITEGYWIADTTVTQALWQAVMENNPSYHTTEQTGLDSVEHLPVEEVSWDDTQLFIQKLIDLYPDLAFGLPSEAEWEYACRAGRSDPFNFDGELTLDKVNYSGIFDEEGWDKQALQRTAEVKSYPANAWGLYEMHGNVWEWCQDYWEGNLGTKAAIDPLTVDQASFRVLRGGGWDGDGRLVRSAIRDGNLPDDRSYNIGLRLFFRSSSLAKLTSYNKPSIHGIGAVRRQPQAAADSTEAVDATRGKQDET